uniref:LAGLIDADG endonuclease n=1 Tax=Powellomyces hirtus TaxID=109895 RepID=A0A4P8NP76_9FUNG|nr:LAGLIDADG endonuclease [Powellomyces hirtus]
MLLNFAIYLNTLDILLKNRLKYSWGLVGRTDGPFWAPDPAVTNFILRGQLVGNFKLLFLTLSFYLLATCDVLGLSISFLLFYNIYYFKGSSETLRENLSHVSAHVPTHKYPKNDEEFGYYLAGLIEGDGHFSTANQLVIAFHSKDIRLAHFIKRYLGCGHVRPVKGKNAVNYIISNKARRQSGSGILKVLNLINGKLRTPAKRNQIINNISYSFNLLPLDGSSFITNHWLAGFIDADGSLQVKVFNRGNRKNPEIRLNLQIDQASCYILDLIFKELGGFLGYRASQDTYYYGSTSFGVAFKLIMYLRNYHLLSYKYVNYIKWYKIYLLIQNKEHLTPEGINKIIAYKESMAYHSKDEPVQ